MNATSLSKEDFFHAVKMFEKNPNTNTARTVRVQTANSHFHNIIRPEDVKRAIELVKGY